MRHTWEPNYTNLLLQTGKLAETGSVNACSCVTVSMWEHMPHSGWSKEKSRSKDHKVLTHEGGTLLVTITRFDQFFLTFLRN